MNKSAHPVYQITDLHENARPRKRWSRLGRKR